jgi:hypothetical protein
MAHLRFSIAPDDLAELRRWARSSQLPAVLVQRARILLLALAGVTNTEIAERMASPARSSSPAAAATPGRGLGGLPDRPDRDDHRPCVEPAGPRSCPSPSTARAGDHPLVYPAAGPRAGRDAQHHCTGLA